MKKTILAFLFVSFLTGIAVAQVPGMNNGNKSSATDAGTLIQAATSKAAKENKSVFVMFHASWCTWCHKMDASMNDAACSDFFSKNFVTVHLVVDETKDKKDLETPGADELRKKYRGDGQGIPFWLVFDNKGNLISDSKMVAANATSDVGENVGCPASGAEVEFFIGVLKKTTTMSAETEKKIRERFRLNEVK